MSEISRAFRRFAELRDKYVMSATTAAETVADEIEREESETASAEPQVDHVKEIRQALVVFEVEMGYLDFDTPDDLRKYRLLLAQLRKVIEKEVIE